MKQEDEALASYRFATLRGAGWSTVAWNGHVFALSEADKTLGSPSSIRTTKRGKRNDLFLAFGLCFSF